MACFCRYFERAFRDNKSSRNFYIGLSELCMVTASEESTDCKCVDCGVLVSL
jgi:hypothetical protein